MRFGVVNTYTARSVDLTPCVAETALPC
jgi:hypothetical protein